MQNGKSQWPCDSEPHLSHQVGLNIVGVYNPSESFHDPGFENLCSKATDVFQWFCMNITYVTTIVAYFLLRIFLNKLVCDMNNVSSSLAGYTHITEFTEVLAICVVM
jgi:hypothetical protein